MSLAVRYLTLMSGWHVRHRSHPGICASMPVMTGPGASSDADVVALPLAWLGLEDQPLIFANQFLGAVHGGEVFLAFGSLQPPVIVSDNHDEVKRALEELSYVPVKVSARFALTPRRLQELRDVLAQLQEKLEAEARAQ